jgi:CHAT domain-containing protein
VVKRGGIVVRRDMAHWPDVLEAIRAVHFQMETLRHGAAPVLRHMASLTQRAIMRLRGLHALIWAPFADDLESCRRLLVVPHAQLGSVPLAALHDGDRFLAQRHEIAVTPSARLALRDFRRERLIPRRVIALGESIRLPHAEQEAHFVASLFPEGSAFVGEQATLKTLAANASQADVLHLACHGSFRSDNPMFSALQLYDGSLTVELTEALRLRPGIVVLSACETGQAERGAGDEIVGLVRAFLVAGAARVLASLWPIDDAATKPFMSVLFGALSTGRTPAAALHAAQLAIMESYPHPFYWAAFTVHGGW